jgi:acetylornithine deacetylase/succinyl-diaminopimelate desuccinylase-like protein
LTGTVDGMGTSAFDIVLHVDPAEVVALTQQLIAIPSPLWHESAVARWIGDWLAARGFAVEMQAVPLADGGTTHQVIGRLAGDGSGPSLMLCGHTDTSDWNGRPFREAEWTHDPYAGDVANGMLYGLGAINMKAGVASILLAAEAVRRAGKRLKGDLLVACVAAETGGGVGAVHLVESGLRPDYCIVTEASDLDVGIISVGYVQGRIRVRGEFKARVPYINPIEKMIKVIAAFGSSYQPLARVENGGWLRFTPHPLLPGFPRMAVRGIEHFKDATTIDFDLRIIPGMTEMQVCEDMRALLDGLAAADPEFSYELIVPASPQRPNMAARDATAPDVPVVAELIKAHQHVTGKLPVVGAGHRIGATADTCHFKAVGIKCVEYGPGFIPTWPMVDECVEVAQIITATRTLAMTATALLT